MNDGARNAVQVVASWGDSPIETTMSEDRALSVGPTGSWMLLPSEVLAADLTLVEPVEAGWLVRAPRAAELLLGEGLEAEGDGERTVLLSDSSSVEVRIGDFRFFVRSTPRPEAVGRTSGSVRWLRWVGVAALLHAIVLGIFALSPPSVSALNMNELTDASRYVTVSLPVPETPTPEPVEVAAEVATAGSESSSAGTAGGGEAAQPAEAGSPAPRRARGRFQPRPVQVADADSASTTGVIRILAAQSWGDDSSPFVVGSDVADGQGGLSDEQTLLLPRGLSYGALTLNSDGVGTCDPRTQDCGRGVVGLGHLTTQGDDGGNGRVPALRAHRTARVPQIHTLPASTTGGLSREQVRRTVRRHLNEVRFCYEQGLQSRPDLGGRVAVRFIITAHGTVQAATLASNELDARVGGCVQHAVQRWTFPASDSPTGVTYPFVMQSGR